MAVNDSFISLLAWRAGKPNIADKDSDASVAIACSVFEELGVTQNVKDLTGASGAGLETAVRDLIREQLPIRDPSKNWQVEKNQLITSFSQYAHLQQLQNLIDNDESRMLRVVIGTDYRVKPDVTVGVVGPLLIPFLHAAISCKFTIRSDRVQNIRHEAVVLTRHRRGRQPHIAGVTLEPLPSRLASIARGTGEIDATYHACLPELRAAVLATNNQNQIDILEELEGQNRLFDLSDLCNVIAL